MDKRFPGWPGGTEAGGASLPAHPPARPIHPEQRL